MGDDGTGQARRTASFDLGFRTQNPVRKERRCSTEDLVDSWPRPLSEMTSQSPQLQPQPQQPFLPPPRGRSNVTTVPPRLEPTSPKTARPDGTASAAPPGVAPRLSEVQLTKMFLDKEIEAKSRKLSALHNRFRGGTPGLLEEGPQHKLFIVSARLPFTILLNEETGKIEYETDAFETNIVDLLAGVVGVQARDVPDGQDTDGSLLEPSDSRKSLQAPQPADRFGAESLAQASPVLVGAPVVRRKSDGGLVTMNEALQEQLESCLPSDLNAVPVFLPPNRDIFADMVIFPLFHYVLPSAETGLGLYDWEGYELINGKFRDAVLKEYSRGDLVWINDYPLMLLPQLLRQERPDIPIGFYLHCVFPSPEVYRILPQREHLLRGVLSSNIIGFHNFQYVQHFLTSCIHVLGLECTATGIEACEHAGGTHTKVIHVPLGIRAEPCHNLLNQEETKRRIRELQDIFELQDTSGKKLLVAVDRLEEKKGIRHKLMAFHKFLQKAPTWATKCVFLQIVDSTEDALEEAEEPGEQQKLLQQVYQMVGEVNSKFGTIGHLPVHFLCQSVSRVDLVALCAKASVMMDTPLRDVLPHSGYTFLYCQQEKECGVLILSEFSGSAQSLRAAALCVNPWDTNAFAEAIQEALEMDPQDRIELHRYGRNHVKYYTLNRWARNFLKELQTAKSECEDERLQIPPQLDHDKPVSAMRKANRRMIILGFSGTLLPHLTRIHTKIFPKLPAVLLANLAVIAEDQNTYLIVISALPRDTLAQTLGNLPCWLIAEGGVCYREPGSDDWHSTVDQSNTEWLAPVKEIMEYFAARTPGSNVVEMESSVSWLYQKTQGDHAAIQSKDLLIHLWAGPLLSAPAEVVVEKDCVNVKPTGTGKALQLDRLLQQICCEDDSDKPTKWMSASTLVMCVGDFSMRDEDVFVTVQKFFEPEGSEWHKPASTPDTDRWDGTAIAEREPHWTEDVNLEANSMSLGTGYNLKMQHERDEDGPFGLHKSQLELAFGEATPLPEKVPSEPEMHVGEDLLRTDSPIGDAPPFPADEDFDSGVPQVFTCTVSKKATRAEYHLCDTTDVAFLIAKLARELKQMRQQPE